MLTAKNLASGLETIINAANMVKMCMVPRLHLSLSHMHHSAEGLSTSINTNYNLMASIIPRPLSHAVLQTGSGNKARIGQ